MKTFTLRNVFIPSTGISIYNFFVTFLSISTVIAQKDTIEVGTGWNMVGSLYNGRVLDIIRTEPTGIIASQFFGYDPFIGYEAKDTLRKGAGYWVKVSENGILIFGSSADWLCGNTLEYSGKIYNTVQVGSQCWLKENLNVGTMIQGIDTSKDNGILEKYCYDDDTSNCNTYGGLYQWNEAMQYTTTPGTRGICPDGWHIPTLAEFETLSNTVSGDGNALKAIGQGTGGGAGTNTSGFSALLAGYRSYLGSFYYLSLALYFWSSTEYNSTNAYAMYLHYTGSGIILGNTYEENGFNVRCMRD